MVRHQNRAVREGVIYLDKKEEVVAEKEVEETTQASSPQVEAPTTEGQTVQEKVDQPTQEQASDVETEEPSDPREYQAKRLAEENRRLKSEIKQRSAFEAYRPQVAPGLVDVRQYTNEFGEVDSARYNQAVETQVRAVAAQTAQEMIDEQNARTKYPDLFDDPDTEQEIADRWFAAKMRGEDASVSDIAKRVHTRNSKDVSKAEKRGAEKMLQEVNVKEQAGLSASTQTSQGSRENQSVEELADLSERTRMGDEDAIAARLSKIPWANK